MKNKEQPKIRFKGFKNNWKKYKVSKIFKVTRGYVLSSDMTKENIEGKYMYPVYSSQTLNNGLMGYYNKFLYENAITWTTDGAKAGTVRYREGKFYCTNVCGVLLSDKMEANKMIAEALNNVAYKYVSKVGNPKLMNNIMSDIEIKIPLDSNEQNKISELLIKLDNLINVHQSKYDKLVRIKKSLLEKMFPNKEEKVPQIRFKGFKNKWEQRKLSELVKYRRGSFPQPYGNKEWYGGENAMPFVQVADVGENLKLNENTKQTISKIAQPMSVFVPKDSVIVTLQGTIGRVAITQYPAYLDRTVLYFDTFIEKDLDKYFWALSVKNKFEEERRKAPGAVIKTITKEALSDFDLDITNKEEQIKIGEFFRKLDNLINLYQIELDKIQRIKKSLLYKMFI